MPASMIDWESVRDAYLERFGVLVDAVSVLDHACEETLFSMLEFAPAIQGEPRAVWASFGALSLPAACEVFVASTVAIGCMDELFERITRVTSPLAPLRVLRCTMFSEPFVAVLLVPPEDGSFLLGEAPGGPRYAFQAVPITRAEWGLAQDQPHRMVELLRSARALVFDPLRDCLIAPGRHASREARHADMLKWARRSLTMALPRLGYFRATGAPQEFSLREERLIAHRRDVLRYLGEPDRVLWDDVVPIDLPDSDPLARAIQTSSGPPDEISVELSARRMPMDAVALVRDALDLYRHLLPLTEQRFFAEFLVEMIATHPYWSALFAEVAPPGVDAPPSIPDHVIDHLADMIPRFHPRQPREHIRARGLVGSLREKRHSTPAERSPAAIMSGR